MWGPWAARIGLPSPGWRCGHIVLGLASLLGSALTPVEPGAPCPVPSQGHHPPAVVTELEDVVGVGGCLGAHDGLKQRVWELLSIHEESTLEEPVSAVLTAEMMWGGESRAETWVMSQALPPFLLTSIKGRITVPGQSTFQKVISFQWSVIVDYPDPE